MSLALKDLAVEHLRQAPGFAGLPTFGNREITTTIRLKDGETNMLAGLIRDEERTVLAGVPGLSDIPLIGRLFANNRRETQQTDIILTLTPHIVRVLELTEADLRPFRLGRGSAASAAAATRATDQPADPRVPRDSRRIGGPARHRAADGVRAQPLPAAAAARQPRPPSQMPGTAVPIVPPLAAEEAAAAAAAKLALVATRSTCAPSDVRRSTSEA